MRGLRRAGGAEPQTVGLTPDTVLNDRRTDTMKTYILRQTQPVQPQSPAPQSQHQTPAPGACPGTPPAPRGPALYVGLDVHSDSLAVSLAPSDATEVRHYGITDAGPDGSNPFAWVTDFRACPVGRRPLRGWFGAGRKARSR